MIDDTEKKRNCSEMLKTMYRKKFRLQPSELRDTALHSFFHSSRIFFCVQEHLGPLCYDVQAPAAPADGEEKWNFEESLPERVISAHKGTEMSVLLSMAGAIQRPHIGECRSDCSRAKYDVYYARSDVSS